MNRVILLLAAHMFAAQAFGECVARAYRLGTEAPLFNLQSCSLAGEVIDTSRIDAPFPQPTEDDKAVFVIPANQASSTTIRNNGEYWHYSGDCSALPLDRTVHLELQTHCSDLGITMDGLLGDVSIESAIPVNTDDLYLFHPKSRQAVSNFLLLANNQGSSFPILETPLSQLLEDGELIKQVREYYFEKHRTLHAVVHGPKLKAEWFIFNDQLWLVRLKSNIDGTENVDLKNIFDEEDHFYSGYSMLKASWFSGKLHYQIGSLEREPSTNKLGYQAVVFDIDNGDVLSRQIKTVVSMSNKNKPIKIELPL